MKKGKMYMIDNLMELIMEILTDHSVALSDGVDFNIIKKENKMMQGILEGDAKKSIISLLESWIKRLNLENDKRYLEYCMGWQEKMISMSENYIQIKHSKNLQALYECWTDNIKRGSNQ